MSHEQYLTQVRSADLAQLEESDISPMILRSQFQTIMGKEWRLRQENFGSFSTDRVFLREGLRHEDAKNILGAACSVLGDKTKSGM